jgi:hypothetical protein
MSQRYRVSAGEGVDRIAFTFGHAPEGIWNAPENNALKASRESGNVLAEGDELFIPDLRPKVEMCTTGRVHLFRRRSVPARLRLKLFEVMKPVAAASWKLEIGGVVQSGLTGDDGVVEAWAPPDATVGVLVYGKPERRLTLHFGELDPIATTRGREQRLANLGFPWGRADGMIDDGAVARFQSSVGLTPTGALDVETLAMLADVHDQTGGFKPQQS